MAQQLSDNGDVVQGRMRERESTFPMIPVDEAISQVLEQALPLDPTTMKLADIPAGTYDMNFGHATFALRC